MVRRAVQLLPNGPVEVEQVTVFTTRGRKTRQKYIIPKPATPPPFTPQRKKTGSLSPTKRRVVPLMQQEDESVPPLAAPDFEPRRSQGKVCWTIDVLQTVVDDGPTRRKMNS